MSINERIGRFIVHNIFFFSMTLPALLYAASMLIPLEYKMDFNIGLGACNIMQLSYNMPIRIFLIMFAAALNILFLGLTLVIGWHYRNNHEIRKSIYKTWKRRSISSIVLLLFLLVNTLCFPDGKLVSAFHFETSSIGTMLVVSVVFFYLSFLGQKETESIKN